MRRVESGKVRVAAAATPPTATTASPPPTTATPKASDIRDDLKRIHGIDAAIEKALNSIGIRSYLQIGEWRMSDIDRVSVRLGFRGRVERENWIEQAQVLSRDGETAFSRRYDRGST